MFPSYRNQSVDSKSKSADWFLYDRNNRRYKVKKGYHGYVIKIIVKTIKWH